MPAPWIIHLVGVQLLTIVTVGIFVKNTHYFPPICRYTAYRIELTFGWSSHYGSICRQTADQTELKFGGPTHYGPSMA